MRFRTCLKFVFGNEKDSFFGETRLFLKCIPGRYGQKKERSITEKGAFSTRSMKFKQVLSSLSQMVTQKWPLNGLFASFSLKIFSGLQSKTCTITPFFILGSNQVDFGGSILPLSARVIISSNCTGNRQKATQSGRPITF